MSNTNFDVYTLEQYEVLTDKPLYHGLAVLKLKKKHYCIEPIMIEFNYFLEKNIQLIYKVTYSFVLSLNTKNFVRLSKSQ